MSRYSSPLRRSRDIERSQKYNGKFKKIKTKSGKTIRVRCKPVWDKIYQDVEKTYVPVRRKMTKEEMEHYKDFIQVQTSVPDGDVKSSE